MRLGTRRWTANAPCPRVQVDCKTHDARICDVISRYQTLLLSKVPLPERRKVRARRELAR